MKKRLLYSALFILNFAFTSSQAQIAGSDTVCPAYIYTYNAVIAGADSFVWSTPSGWYILSGQGTSQVQLFCNQSDGQVCVDGYDSLGVFVMQYCHTVYWGGGGSGWDAVLNIISPCPCSPFTISVAPNGSGGNCAGCGTGCYQSPNMAYGIYDDVWPLGVFLGIADGSGFFSPDPFMFLTYYVYEIDTTFGIANAILISGGACGGTVNNVISIPSCYIPPIALQSIPDPVCLGDTFLLTDVSGLALANYYWMTFDPGITIIDPSANVTMQGIVTNASGSLQITVSCLDFSGCNYNGGYTLTVVNCSALPVASFAAVSNPICSNTCTSFNNLSQGATSYQWFFPGGSPAGSNDSVPPAICYSASGNYDVTLIATNSNGSDTLSFTNYIVVNPLPIAPVISQSSDTLFVQPVYASYQWYHDSLPISGATNYFYPVPQDGNYNIVVYDSNGCVLGAGVLNVVTSLGSYGDSRGEGVNVSPNPFTSKIALLLSSLQNEKAEIKVFNTVGEEVYNNEFSIVNPELSIDLSFLQQGIYFLTVQTDKEFYREKVVKY